jgi:hypothetical protein
VIISELFYDYENVRGGPGSDLRVKMGVFIGGRAYSAGVGDDASIKEKDKFRRKCITQKVIK